MTDTDIHIGVLNDAGNTLSPGLGAAYPRVAKAFATWCNAAGGINGRKIVIEDRDAKLFNAAAVVTDACQSDFMLVGGGAALDEPTIAPREKCGLGSIPAINASYPDQTSKLQAVVGRASPTESNWGLFRVLQPEHASAFDKIGIVALDTPTVRGPYESFAKVLESKGMKVTSFQAISQNLDNVRTYIQPLVGKSDALVLAFTAPAIFQAMADVGYTPSLVVDPGSA
ncbi:MAG: ABC transporter substrate-binding protein, partial [Actinobacteria bacterium]|nr:ABC transporter substrate-binding protein [Actinomycetota bacterium]